MANPLDPVMDWYAVAFDSLRVTQRVIQKPITNAVTDKHVFFGKSQPDNVKSLEDARQQLRQLVVLALTAIFERTLRDFLNQIPLTAILPTDPTREKVREELLKDIEFWNISSKVLEVFPTVNPGLRGQVKQIVDLRNWVAHGQVLHKPPPSNATPEEAYQRLTDFLTQARVIT